MLKKIQFTLSIGILLSGNVAIADTATTENDIIVMMKPNGSLQCDSTQGKSRIEMQRELTEQGISVSAAYCGHFKTEQPTQRLTDEEELQGNQPVQRVENEEEDETSASVPIQREEQVAKPNNTGLSDNLKSGIENLSGMSIDNVKVHYNSAKPAQLNALAYAQGTACGLPTGQLNIYEITTEQSQIDKARSLGFEDLSSDVVIDKTCPNNALDILVNNNPKNAVKVRTLLANAVTKNMLHTLVIEDKSGNFSVCVEANVQTTDAQFQVWANKLKSIQRISHSNVIITPRQTSCLLK